MSIPRYRNTTFVQRFKNEGIHMFTPGRYRVNGRDTLQNPFSIRSLDKIVSWLQRGEQGVGWLHSATTASVPVGRS